MPKLIHGKGINDLPRGTCSVNRKMLPFYETWTHMLARCYKPSRPTYQDCTVCDEWLTLSVFKEWYDANYIEGYELDKDLLVKGNKVYSPQTCCFIPQELNTLLLDSAANRGKYPIGVSKSGNKFKARLRKYNEPVHIGTFTCVEDASNAYQEAKKAHVLEVVKTYRGIVPDYVLDAIPYTS